ncbi:preprotein translocase subunit YajC [Wolbachia endosymbiont of Howardula sp.]|uniref:preprotein translocase subunit YajC n=1 Tax=Wolbachia endosymbiont of Howardula sp. TaxID=2916816 RepID=UPI00217F06CC|nr:preprotein translocase subunit YajC [Wolbachia endosymbiont of Howardula sp.]UWI83129.1 preprotein translocase subunit YajC [Wolbachia endosymbiont of Howardula sp.]
MQWIERSIANITTSFANLIPLILICIVFYFFVIRPHHKKIKEHRKILDGIKISDVIITTGGIIGTINKIDKIHGQLLLAIAPKVEVRILISAISEVLNTAIHQDTINPIIKVKNQKILKNIKTNTNI